MAECRWTQQRWQEEEGSTWMVVAGYKKVTRRYDIIHTQEQTKLPNKGWEEIFI